MFQIQSKLSSNIFYVLFTTIFLTLVGCNGDDDAPLPTSSFTFDATTNVLGQAPLNVQFTSQAENGVSQIWNFGDGTASTEESPLHVYAVGGDYVVSLTVTNVDGVEVVDETTITLASPLEGAWVLDSLASPTIDTIAATGRFTGAFEFGVSHDNAICPGTNLSAVTAWNPSDGWVSYLDFVESNNGYFSFWSEVIFSGNYFGRRDFFQNEFIFSNDGTYEVDLKGELIFPDYMVAEEREYLESEDWSSIPGALGDLSAFKSDNSYSFTVEESSDYPGFGELTLSGEGAFLGAYFGGFVAAEGGQSGRLPKPEYKFIISSVSSDELVVGGFAGDILCASDWMVLKFKKVN